jgi:glutamate synthase domain-containing protein 3
VLSAAEQETKVDANLWHRGQSDEAQLRKLIEEHHRWTGSLRARDILDNWSEARGRFVKVFPNEYKRALGELNATKTADATIAKAMGKEESAKKSGKSVPAK